MEPLYLSTPGIEAKDKGSLLHAALEYIWTHIRSQAELMALSEEDSAVLIQAAVDHAWQSIGLSVSASTEAFERERMARVLGEWLALECTRPAFEVEQCEKPDPGVMGSDVDLVSLAAMVRDNAESIDRQSERFAVNVASYLMPIERVNQGVARDIHH